MKRRILFLSLIMACAWFRATNSYCDVLSLCNESVRIDAEVEYVRNGYRYFRGDPELSLSGIALRGDMIFASDANDHPYIFYLEKASFRVKDRSNIIEGYSDEAILNLSECTLDLIGNAFIENKSGKKHYKNVRYFLIRNEIEPILLHIDQSPRSGTAR